MIDANPDKPLNLHAILSERLKTGDFSNFEIIKTADLGKKISTL